MGKRTEWEGTTLSDQHLFWAKRALRILQTVHAQALDSCRSHSSVLTFLTKRPYWRIKDSPSIKHFPFNWPTLTILFNRKAERTHVQPSAVQENTGLLPRNPFPTARGHEGAPDAGGKPCQRPPARHAVGQAGPHKPPPSPPPGPAPKGTDASTPQAGGPSTGQACPPPQLAQPCLHATRIQNACPTQPASAP